MFNSQESTESKFREPRDEERERLEESSLETEKDEGEDGEGFARRIFGAGVENDDEEEAKCRSVDFAAITLLILQSKV